MKNFTRVLSLILIIIGSSFIFGSCGYNPFAKAQLTDSEVIEEAKLSLKDDYSSTFIYSNMSLVNYVDIEGNKVYIDWSSSNNSLINASTGKVYRNLENNICSLTANLTYHDLSESVTFDYTLPAKKYENPYPQFSSSGSEIQFSVSYLAYDDSNNLTIKLQVYNNLSSKQTLYGINNFTFSIATSRIIVNYSNYLVRSITYSNNTQKQFTCNYGEYVTITLPVIAYNDLSYPSELARITEPIFSVESQITYYTLAS